MKAITRSFYLLIGLSITAISASAQIDSAKHFDPDSNAHNIGQFHQTQITTPVDSPKNGNANQPSGNPGGKTVVKPQPIQNIGSIMGKLVDAKNQPVSYATVTLIRPDSSVVNGDLTKDDGTFSISPTGLGTFSLRIQAIGLASKTLSVQVTAAVPDKDMGNIKVSSGTNNLKEVDIVAEKPIMEMSVDKKVFNVEKNITTAGGSATDVLSNVPAVSVDVDGNVSLRNNSNITILIDGKPSTLLGSDQASALQSLPASSIESVEVITNPSAKYDAAGSTGIINIVTKKDNKFGFNGNLSLSAGTGDKYNGSLGLNLHKGKWNVFLNSSVRFNSNYNNTTTDINYDVPSSVYKRDSSSHSFEHAQRHFDAAFNTIGASYDINKRNNITFTQNVNVMNFGYTDTSNFALKRISDNTTNYVERRFSNANGGPLSFSSALDYKGKFKKQGEEIDADATFVTSSISRSQHYTTAISNVGADTYGAYTETAPSTGTNNTFTGYVDYTDPLFTKNGKLGLGVKTQLYNFTSSNNPLIDSNNVTSTDYALKNNFNYTQQVDAAYVNWNDQYGKFSYQVGLRAEYNLYTGTDYILSNKTYTNTYFNPFPSAFVSYQLPDQQSIYLNYSRRTNRPNFFQLLPYKDVSNSALVSEGNPDLLPEFIHNVELAYTKQDKRGDNFIISGYYTYTQNLTERIVRPVLASDSLPSTFSNSQFTQPINLASGVTYGLELTGHIQILPIWDATLDFNFFQNKINAGNTGDSSLAPYISDNSGFSWFGKVNTNVRLPAGLSLQLNGNYQSAKPIAQGTMKEVAWLDVALRKNLWKNKATLVLNCSDIFNSRKYTTIYNQTSYTETLYRDRESRVGTITFTYRFGSKATTGTQGGKKGKGGNNQPTQQDRENNLKQGGDDEGGGGMGGNNGGGGSGPSNTGGGKAQ